MLLKTPLARHRTAGFTIVEVMMASLILVVGFIGLIQAITLGSEMMATARRQTLAAAIINHEIDKLRFSSWTTVSGLPTASTALTIDSQFSTAITGVGLTTTGTATITLSRSVTDLTANLREVAFTVIWTKSGTSSAAPTATGSWLDQLSFSGESSLARTYTRKNSAYFGKYGLSLSYQRS